MHELYTDSHRYKPLMREINASLSLQFAHVTLAMVLGSHSEHTYGEDVANNKLSPTHLMYSVHVKCTYTYHVYSGIHTAQQSDELITTNKLFYAGIIGVSRGRVHE